MCSFGSMRLRELTVPVCSCSHKSDQSLAHLSTVTVMISSVWLTLILTAFLHLITGVNIVFAYHSAYITCYLRSIYSSSQIQTSHLSLTNFATSLLLSLPRERFYHKVESCVFSTGSIVSVLISQLLFILQSLTFFYSAQSLKLPIKTLSVVYKVNYNLLMTWQMC